MENNWQNINATVIICDCTAFFPHFSIARKLYRYIENYTIVEKIW